MVKAMSPITTDEESHYTQTPQANQPFTHTPRPASTAQRDSFELSFPSITNTTLKKLTVVEFIQNITLDKQQHKPKDTLTCQSRDA